MYFSKTTALTITSFLQLLAVSGAPLSFPRDGTLSASYASLSKPIVSPYYLYFGNPDTPKLADAFSSLNMKSATIGFASAPKGSCTLTSDLDGLVSDAQAFIAEGGAISLSFGGNLQDQTDPRQHVQQACTDAPSLTKLIEGAMSQFNTHNIEFDIEDNTLLSDTASAARLAQALVQVKKDFSDTFVTYTVGANPSGMPSQQNAYVQAAKDNGLTIDALILMTMNLGGSDVVQDAQTAVTGGAAQLATIYSLKSDAAFQKMGMLPSIGVDNDKQFVNLDGMTTLGQFAKSKGLSTFSYWSFNRDFPGDAGSTTQSLSDSSSPDQTIPSQFFQTLLSSVSGSASSSVSGSASSSASSDTLASGASVKTDIAVQANPLPPSNKQPGQKPSLPPPTAAAAPGGTSNSTSAGGSNSTVSS